MRLLDDQLRGTSVDLVLNREISGIQVQFADPTQVIGTRGFAVLRSTDGGVSWIKIGSAAGRGGEALLDRIALYGRATRRRVHHIYPYDGEKWLLVNKGEFLVLDEHGRVKRIPMPGSGSRPLRDGLVIQGERIIFGEYCLNPHRSGVSIYSVRGGSQDALFQFAPGRIRHIHTLQYDPYGESYWIGTGDEDPECLVGRFTSDFEVLQVLEEGSQQWRTVSFAFLPGGVYWGTDIPEGGNQVFRYDRKTSAVEPVFEVQGPIYYSRVVNDWILFCTTAEDHSSFGGLGRIYLYNHKTGAHSVGWQDRKDWLPSHLFGYGIYEFPRGGLEGNAFWVSTRGFRGGTRSLLFEIRDE